jgi:hypothetical protein
MKGPVRLAALGMTGALLAGAAMAQPQALPPDRPVQMGGVEVVCTGVGLDARQNPHWIAYSLRVEIAGAGGRYLGDAQIDLRKDGASLLSVRCDGPWLLFRLAPGRYQVDAVLNGQTVSSAAFVPATGQGRIILRFVERSAVASYPMNYADEAAQTLGVRNGKMDVFSMTGGGAMPSVSGTIGGKGPELRLRWRLGK